MRAFLDANVLLWAIYRPDQLTSAVREVLINPDNVRFVCEATQWELLNKVSRGRIPFAGTSVVEVVQRIRDLQVQYVPVLQGDTIAAAYAAEPP